MVREEEKVLGGPEGAAVAVEILEAGAVTWLVTQQGGRQNMYLNVTLFPPTCWHQRPKKLVHVVPKGHDKETSWILGKVPEFLHLDS